MNPPPLPPSVTNKSSFPHQAATASLLAPLLVLIVSFVKSAFLHTQNPAMADVIIDGICGILIFIGFMFGILALVGISKYGPKGILGKGIAGLTINGILSVIFMTNLIIGYQKSLQSRTAALQRVRSVEADIHSSNQKNFDPKKGITNTDAGKLDRLSSAFKDASQNLSGDDASISTAMAAHFARLRDALTNYQSAVLTLRNAEVLARFNPTNKTQFADRRELVESFLRANSNLAQVMTNSENGIIADLTKSHVSDAHIKTFMDGFHSSAAPLNAISLQIRKCDDRMGAALLDALNLLETEWYKWTIDPKNGKVRFEDHQDLEAYNKAVQDLHAASDDQLKLEKQLVRAQQMMPAP